MGVTLTKLADSLDYWGKHPVVIYDLTPDTSYPSGGYAIAGADIGMKNIDGVQFIGGNAAAGRLIPWWDNVNKKFMLLFPTGGATASPGTVTDPIVSAGSATASAVDTTQPNITPGRGKELLNGVNASASTFRALFICEGA